MIVGSVVQVIDLVERFMTFCSGRRVSSMFRGVVLCDDCVFVRVCVYVCLV